MNINRSPWPAALIVFGVLSRLVTINGVPATTRLHSRSMSVGDDEQEIERMYEMLDSYHQKRSAAAAQRRDTRAGITDTDGEAHAEDVPKFHYEVHHVTHQFGHRTPADVKLRQVARHAASSVTDDDDDDSASPPASAAGHVTSLSDDDHNSQRRQETDNNYYYEEASKREELGPVEPLARVDSSPNKSPSSISDVYFVAVVVGCSVAGLAGLMVAAVCWYRLHKKMKATSEVSYPAYGVTGPAGSPTSKDGSPGDRKLAQSAQMYHYQHQKQQMIASERISQEQASGRVDARSDVESEDDNDDADYTVFECRGLGATNGEMEVRNPLFSDQQTSGTAVTDSTGSAPGPASAGPAAASQTKK